MQPDSTERVFRVQTGDTITELRGIAYGAAGVVRLAVEDSGLVGNFDTAAGDCWQSIGSWIDSTLTLEPDVRDVLVTQVVNWALATHTIGKSPSLPF